MFYRRKILLGLLEALRFQVSKTDMQKYLFLVSQEQKTPSYHFVPYRFGCYSFQADADKRTLAKYGLIRSHDKWVLVNRQGFLPTLKPEDGAAIRKVVQAFRRVRGRDLVRHVYRNYPYYAINSEIKHDVLSRAEQQIVEERRPAPTSPRLYTIGYEGLSLEQFLNKLVRQSVAVLCDVRRNAISMKYGFSKRLLQHACDGVGISYIHMPELGIDSQKRKHLRSRSDIDALFHDYVNTTLSESKDSLDSIVKLVRKNGRVALTCFEADADLCHRGCVASALLARSDFGHQVAHL